MNEPDLADLDDKKVHQAFESAEEMEHPDKLDLHTSADAVRALRAHWKDSRTRVVRTGLLGLDQTLGGGLRAGDLMALAGPTGQGKTGFLLHIARHATKDGARVIYFSCEIDEAESAARLAALERYHLPDATDAVGFGDILDGKPSDAVTGQAIDLVEAASEFLYIEQIPDGGTVDDVRAKAEALRESYPNDPLVVIVDPLQRLFVGEGGARSGVVARSINANETDRVGHVGLALKRVALDARAAVIFGSDSTMQAASDDGLGSSSGLRGSYTLSNAATSIFWLYVADDPEKLVKKLNERRLEWARDVHEINMEVAGLPKIQPLVPKPAALECRKNRRGRRNVAIPLVSVPGANLFLDGDVEPFQVPGASR